MGERLLGRFAHAEKHGGGDSKRVGRREQPTHGDLDLFTYPHSIVDGSLAQGPPVGQPFSAQLDKNAELQNVS
jgi:hypothetical protein